MSRSCGKHEGDDFRRLLSHFSFFPFPLSHANFPDVDGVLTTRSISHSPRRARPLTHWLRLEDRLATAVAPLTFADPSRLGLSAASVSQFLSASADGQLFAFQSDAPDLVPNDFNNQSDVFVYFRATGRVELVSVNVAGSDSGNMPSRNPKVSPDGRYVLFEGQSNNLGPTAPAFADQIFAHDSQTGTTILVSANNAGAGGGRGSQNATWAPNSTQVLFESDSGDFVPNDLNGGIDIFLRDLATKKTTRVSEAADGTDPSPPFFGTLSSNAVMSPRASPDSCRCFGFAGCWTSRSRPTSGRRPSTRQS